MKLTDKYHDAIKLSSSKQNKQNRKRQHKTSNKVTDFLERKVKLLCNKNKECIDVLEIIGSLAISLSC